MEDVMENLKQLLGEELFSQVEAKLEGKKIMVDDGNFIPKSRFNEVNEARKELDKKLKEKDEQLTEISKKYSENKDLASELEKLKNEKKEIVENYEAKIKANEFNYALDGALTNAKCRNLKSVKANLDMDSIKLENGKLEGLDEQLKALKESDSYLFEDVVPSNTGGVGNFARGGKQVITKEQFANMSYTEKCNLFNNNKELYNSLNNQ